MKNIITKLAITAAVIAGFIVVALPAVSYAQSKADICEGIGLTGGPGGCAQPAGGGSVEGTITTVINILSVAVGVVAVIMIIIGGFKYITSSGDSSNVTSAKNTILYAIIGLVIVALAQIIVRFVLNRVSP